MKRATFISIFICTHLLFIFFQIDKHNKLISLSYTKQKYENEIKSLSQKKQELSQNLYNLQKSSTIKKFASEKLGMYGVNIKQVKKIYLAQACIEPAEKPTMYENTSKKQFTSSKPEEPTSLATLRYGPKGPTQGERGGECLALTPIQKENPITISAPIQKEIELKNNHLGPRQKSSLITISAPIQKESILKNNKKIKKKLTLANHNIQAKS